MSNETLYDHNQQPIIYNEESGLHTIEGKCLHIEKSSNAGMYDCTVEANNRTYCITLNLPLGSDFQPPNNYPKVDDLIIIYAEGIEMSTTNYGNPIYLGYSEICRTQIEVSDSLRKTVIRIINTVLRHNGDKDTSKCQYSNEELNDVVYNLTHLSDADMNEVRNLPIRSR